jgi:hypothetical protein
VSEVVLVPQARRTVEGLRCLTYRMVEAGVDPALVEECRRLAQALLEDLREVGA